ncbi:hypothetical protein LWM68_46425 [Niabella sp. W65]|nr:hypothetical protein [Niabella sp. W65]MCH7369515.1 hypothetical protein [Niabella sp. W65]
MSRCVFNEASEDEVQQFQQLLNNNPVLQQQYDLLRQVFGAPGAPALTDPGNYESQALSLLDKAEKLDVLIRQENIRPL